MDHKIQNHHTDDIEKKKHKNYYSHHLSNQQKNHKIHLLRLRIIHLY